MTNKNLLGGQLTERRVSWRRLTFMLVAVGVAGAGTYVATSDKLSVKVDALILSNRVAVATSYDARVKQVLVRSGDPVIAGQKIAVLESPSMIRSLSELSGRLAELDTRVARLQARRTMIKALLPLAQANATGTQDMAQTLGGAFKLGVTTNKGYQDAVAAQFTAYERFAALAAEGESIDAEIKSIIDARKELTGAYEALRNVYSDGVLTAQISGTVGSTVAMEGEALVAGNRIGQIYSGTPFVLAYIQDNGIVGTLGLVKEGDTVRVSDGRRTVLGKIQKVFAFAEALPPEYQRPVGTRERSRVARVEIPSDSDFPIEQKARIDVCYFDKCATMAETIARNWPKVKAYARAFVTLLAADTAQKHAPLDDSGVAPPTGFVANKVVDSFNLAP